MTLSSELILVQLLYISLCAVLRPSFKSQLKGYQYRMEVLDFIYYLGEGILMLSIILHIQSGVLERQVFTNGWPDFTMV